MAYLGTPVLLDTLIYQPDNSLVRQSYAPQMLHMLNLAGFGMAAWDENSHQPEHPFLYKTTDIPVFDSNLKTLAQKVRTSCLLAHVRGVPYTHEARVEQANVHPFQFPGFRMALAHNGDLYGFSKMKFELLRYIKPEIAHQISGTTDSEWIYALMMSRVADPTKDLELKEILPAVEETLEIIRDVRHKMGIAISSSVNLFLCDGNDLVATRFTFDFGCYANKVHEANLSYLSLWFTIGKNYGWHDNEWKMVGGDQGADSVLVSSEPLSHDISTWIEVPEYSLLYVTTNTRGKREVQMLPLNV
ncbi:MAG: class II glutamine amidotransferase [Deltaproteobacteria bacterium]|nr:class II glutamine amidotransferase [Deltaproteobacteria bacterium]